MFFSKINKKRVNKENLKNKFSLKTNQAFSLVELLVTIGILTMVSGVVFLNQSQFNNNVLIENLAYEISLAIRQAQSYGIQVKQTRTGFGEGYGVYFDTDSDGLIIFTDDDPNFFYDVGSDDIVDVLKMTDGNKVSKLCVDAYGSVDDVSIVFLRPNPDAIFCYKETASSSCISNYSNVEIEVSNGRTGDDLVTKSIKIWNTGQISTD